MQYIYSAMLLHAMGKPVNEQNIINVIKSAGAEPDTTQVKALVAALEGVDIKDVLAKAAAAPVMAAPAASGAPAPEQKGAGKEEKKEEEKTVSEEEAAAGLGALFG